MFQRKRKCSTFASLSLTLWKRIQIGFNSLRKLPAQSLICLCTICKKSVLLQITTMQYQYVTAT